jgi:hypothetical protein
MLYVVAATWVSVAVTVPRLSCAADKGAVIELDASVKSAEYTLEPGSYRFRVTNLRPVSPFPYSFRVVDTMLLEPELDLKDFFSKAGELADDPCIKASQNIAKQLQKAETESAVREQMSKARAELEGAECSPQKVDRQLQQLRDITSYEIPQALALREARVIKIQVLNGEKSISEQAFSAPQSSAWLFSYGFTFVRDKNDAYFSQPQPDVANSYTIEKSHRDATFDSVPSVFLARRTDGQREHKWCLGCRLMPVFGIGTDLEDVSAFLGLGAMFGDNVMVTVGGAVTRQDRLNGKYEVGQAIGQDLSNDQLVESTWDTTYYIGLTFRLGSASLAAIKGGESASATEPKVAE